MIKLFRMNDADWVAAKTLEEAKQCLADFFANGIIDKAFEEEFLDNPREITEQEMDTFKFIDEEEIDNLGEGDHNTFEERLDVYYKACPTFRQALANKIADGGKFPCHFASAE